MSGGFLSLNYLALYHCWCGNSHRHTSNDFPADIVYFFHWQCYISIIFSHNKSAVVLSSDLIAICVYRYLLMKFPYLMTIQMLKTMI